MTNLNQILLGGSVIEAPEYKQKDGSAVFFVESARFVRETPESDYVKKMIHVKIVTFGQLSDNCVAAIRVGTGTSVIGRINYDDAGFFCIVADHVIFKPETTKKE